MVLDLVAIDKSIKERYTILVTGTLSSARSYIINTPNGKIFHKRYEVREKVKDSAKDTTLVEPEKFNRMVYSLPATANININIPLEMKVASEVMATLRWRNLGLPCQDLLHYDGKFTTIFRYMNGYSFEKVLNGPVNSKEFCKVLDSFHYIRKKAKEFKNPEILHSDPYANNFFYDSDRDIVVPFDSSKVNKRNMEFDEIDARLNLFFLSKLFHLKTDEDAKLAYLNQSVERLTRQERRLISRLYFDPIEQRKYFESKDLQKDNVIDIYFRKDVRDNILHFLNRRI